MKNGHIYLSQIKLDVLKFIKYFIHHNDYAPTYKEVGSKFRFSRARAGAIIAELYKLNLICTQIVPRYQLILLSFIKILKSASSDLN